MHSSHLPSIAANRPGLLAQSSQLEVEAPSRDLAMRQLINNAEWDINLPTCRHDSCKLAHLPADQPCLKARLVLGNQQILQASFGFEDPMELGVLQLPGSLAASRFLTGSHHGE